MKFTPVEQKIYLKVLKDFRRWLIKNNGRTEDAEDCCADAIMNYLLKKDQLNLVTESEIGAYLFSTAKYMWFRVINKDSDVPLSPNHNTGNEEFPFEKWEINEEKYKIIEECLSLLHKKGRELIELFYLHGKSMNEVVQILGYSNADSAKTAKNKFMNQVRECSRHKLQKLQV
jgi:RNA polymerase sigma factor (sigma-70 family)